MQKQSQAMCKNLGPQLTINANLLSYLEPRDDTQQPLWNLCVMPLCGT